MISCTTYLGMYCPVGLRSPGRCKCVKVGQSKDVISGLGLHGELCVFNRQAGRYARGTVKYKQPQRRIPARDAELFRSVTQRVASRRPVC